MNQKRASFMNIMIMKKFTSLLIACSLALAGPALAQNRQAASKKKKKTPATTTQSGAAKSQKAGAKQKSATLRTST